MALSLSNPAHPYKELGLNPALFSSDMQGRDVTELVVKATERFVAKSIVDMQNNIAGTVTNEYKSVLRTDLAKLEKLSAVMQSRDLDVPLSSVVKALGIPKDHFYYASVLNKRPLQKLHLPGSTINFEQIGALRFTIIPVDSTPSVAPISSQAAISFHTGDAKAAQPQTPAKGFSGFARGNSPS